MLATGTSRGPPRERRRYCHTFRPSPGPPFEFVTRDRTELDSNFIYSSYLKSFRRGHPMLWVPHVLYFKPQAKVLTFLLCHASALVACFPEDPTAILGYALYEHTPDALILHYLYTKLHGMGVGRGLLRAVAGDRRLVIATHMCDDYEALRAKALPMRVVYDPYLLPRLMARE